VASHRCVEIIGRNIMRSHDFRGDGVASCNPFV